MVKQIMVNCKGIMVSLWERIPWKFATIFAKPSQFQCQVLLVNGWKVGGLGVGVVWLVG